MKEGLNRTARLRLAEAQARMRRLPLSQLMIHLAFPNRLPVQQGFDVHLIFDDYGTHKTAARTLRLRRLDHSAGVKALVSHFGE
jgi:hypothetical protein